MQTTSLLKQKISEKKLCKIKCEIWEMTVK